MSKKKKNSLFELVNNQVVVCMDDTFAFIAGYTSSGVSYGTTWEEIGIDPSLPFEEKKDLYLSGCYKIPVLTDFQKSDLKAMLDTLDDIQVKLEVYDDLSGINDLCDTTDSVRDVMERIDDLYRPHLTERGWLPDRQSLMGWVNFNRKRGSILLDNSQQTRQPS